MGNSNYLQIVLRVMEVLNKREQGEIILAGGAVRDMLMGHTPKDFDFVVLRGPAEEEKYIDMSEGWVLYLTRELGIPISSIKEYEHYRKEDGGRIAYVVKFQYEGLDFDLIEYTERQEDDRDQVSKFDCSLNMLSMDDRGVVTVQPEALEVLAGIADVRPLRTLDVDWTERVNHLFGKVNAPRQPILFSPGIIDVEHTL